MPEKTSEYKPLVLVDTADLSEDVWLEYRRRGIGGSDAAAILGVSPFATARDLYCAFAGVDEFVFSFVFHLSEKIFIP